MKIEAYPTRLVAVSDGACQGQDHIIVYLEHRVFQEVRAFALTRLDARALAITLQLLLADPAPEPAPGCEVQP